MFQKKWTLKTFIRKLFKITAWLTGSVIVLLLILIIAIQMPWVQARMVQKLVSIAEETLGTKVSVKKISLAFPKRVIIDGLYIQDQKKDTLLFVGSLSVGTDLWALLHHSIQLNSIDITTLRSHITRPGENNDFNYDFIIRKFQDTVITAPVDTTSVPWTFRFGNVSIQHVGILFNDQRGGDHGNILLGKLDVKTERIDLSRSIYDIRSIEIADVSGEFIQTKTSASSPDTTSSRLPLLSVKQIDLHHIRFNWEQEATGKVAQLSLGDASLEAKQIDLPKQLIALDKFTLSNTQAIYRQMKTKPALENPTPPSTDKKKSNAAAWKISLSKIELSKNSIQYYDFNQPVSQHGADYAHLWISPFTLHASGINIDQNNYAANIDELSLADHNGFILNELKGNVHLTNHSAQFNNVKIRSGKSSISLNGKAGFNSLVSLADSWPKALVSLNILPSRIALSDARYFAYDQLTALPSKIGADSFIEIAGNLEGPLNDLTFDHLKIRTLHETSLSASGTVKGLPAVETMRFKIHVDSLNTNKTDLLVVLPDSLVPSSVNLPANISLNGDFDGTLRNSNVVVSLKTSDGQLDAAGHYNLDSASIGAYQGKLTLTKVAAGRLLKQDSLGTVSLTALVQGTGLNMQDLDANLSVHVTEIGYNNYTYRDFVAEGSLKNYFYTGKATLHDKNLDFELSGEFDQRQEVPLYVLKADLINADLQALHLTSRPIRSRGTLDVKLSTSDFMAMNGKIAIRKVAIFDGKTLYKVDSLLVASISTKKQTEIKINSDIIDGNFTGTINLASLPSVLENHLNTYFALKDTMRKEPMAAQNFEFSLTLKKTDLITKIIFPSLESFQSSPLTGSYNSDLKLLKIHAEVRRLHYEDIRVRSFIVDVKSDKKSLNFDVSLQNFRYDSLKIPGMSLGGIIANDSIKTKLIILDSLDKQKYLLGAVFNSFKDDFQFRFVPGQVFLNYNEWKVPDDNYIRWEKQRMRANNFSLSHDQEKILMETKGVKDSVVQIGFRQLDLDDIFNIVSGSTSIVGGRLDGDVSLFLNKNGAFNSSVRIADLTIMQRSWGEISLTAGRVTTDKFDLKLTAKGEHTDVLMEGNYVAQKPASVLHLSVNVGKIDLELIEPLSSGQIKKPTGQLTGQLDISGTIAKPSIKGDVTFKNATFTSSYVNTAFTLRNETLHFNGSGLTLSNFTILDEARNTAVFRGTVDTKDYRDFNLNLNLTTKNFRVLNTTSANNSLYFGSVKMNATAKVTGPLRLPVVDVRVGFTSDTEFSYVVPANSKGVIDKKGIVEFVDKKPPKDPFMASLALKDTVQNMLKGFDLTATIELTSDEKFNIIIDPRSGDKLSVQGSTTLVVKIDPSGNMNLSGQYEISRGAYNFSFYKLVHRDFELLKGGTISWSGDPLDAKLNLQALYKVETSPVELLAAQSTDLSNNYKQAYPFLVYLYIKGDLSAPDISFSLDMPEANKSVLGGSVYAAIQDINTREPDLNKQVFALLVLRRFMADNPLENQVTTSFSSNARSSVSGLLTDQLQRLSSNIKGVQLSVDVKSFDNYTTGTAANQTQLQLGVSKTLLHNRLVVKLAGNVDIAGDDTNQNSFTDYIGDLALEYKIDSDGRLRLTGFRNSDYDMIDGELIKTGAGLIYVKDYNTLSELFKPNAKTGN